MADFGLCNYEKCEKSSMCKRFLHKDSTNPIYFRFENICRENNGYKWLMEIKQEIIVKEEGDT